MARGCQFAGALDDHQPLQAAGPAPHDGIFTTDISGYGSRA